MFGFRLFIVFMAFSNWQIKCEKFYTILAPQQIRPFSIYKFTISFVNVTLPITIDYDLMSGEKSIAKRSNVIVSEYSQIFDIQLNALIKSNYALIVNGNGPLKFREEIGLIYSDRIYDVRIQTDRRVYKPEDLLRFHVLVAADGDGRNDTFNIRLKDPNNVIVNEWPEQELKTGFFTAVYQFARELKLGKWSIELDASRTGQIVRKQFLIAQHILPNYAIDIQVPRYVLFADRKLLIGIGARHFYGMNIVGNVTVAVYGRYRSGILQPIFQNPPRKLQSLVDGRAEFGFDFEQDLRLRIERSRDLIVDVIVEEALTNLKQNRSVPVTVFKNRYELRLITNRDNLAYQPGLDYRCELHLLNMDGTLARNQTGSIRIRYRFDGDTSIDRRFEIAVKPNGIVKLQLQTFRNVTGSLRLEAEFDTFKELFDLIPATSQSHLQINQLQKNRNEFLLEFPDRIQSVFYTVYDRSSESIAITKKLDFPSVRNKTILQLPPSFNNRQLYLYVYYVKDGTNEIVNGHLRNADIDGQNEPETVRISHRIEQQTLIFEIDGPSNEIVSLALQSDVDQQQRPLKPSELRLLTNANYYRSPAQPLASKSQILTTATRPPLAGPYAFSRIPKPVSNEPRVYLTNPLELLSGSFLENVTLNSRGAGRIKIPAIVDSTTNRFDVIEAVAIDDRRRRRLTIASETVDFKAFSQQLFRVSVNVPASIKLGEQVRVPVVVRNLAARTLPVTVIFKNDEQMVYDLVTSGDQEQQFETFKKRELTIRENQYETIFFEIRAIKIGETRIVIEAGNETIREPLRVVNEGLEQSQTARYWCESGFERTVSLTIPEYQISDSIQCEISVSKNPFAIIEQNLNLEIISQFAATATGTCDLAVLNLVPAVLLANNSPVLLRKLQLGVQQVLRYWNSETGSFRVLVRDNEPGSVWMTAQVLFWLEKVRLVVYIDEFVLEKSYEWLAGKQEAGSGSFIETGTIVHQSLQSDPVALTAFVMLTFLEYSKRDLRRYETVVALGSEFVANSANVAVNPLALALAAYALSESNDSQAIPFQNKLTSLSTSNESDELWWISMPDSRNLWKQYANAADIETTAYALLAIVSRRRAQDSATANRIVNWLLRQQNYRGGFTSIQDTITGLWSLKRYFSEDLEAVRKLSEPVAVNVHFETIVESDLEPVRDSIDLSVDSKMGSSIQSRLFPERKQVEISVRGRGTVFVQVSFRYNTNVTGAWPLFILDPQINKISTEHFLRLSLCLSFSNSNLTLMDYSNMAVMEVKLPTGFVLDTNTIPALQLAPKIVNVQVRERKTTVLLIYNRIGVEDLCTSISAHRIHAVAAGTLRPGSISVYDMYNNAARARLFYENRNSRREDDRELTQSVTAGGDIEQARIRPISENDVEIIPRDERKTKSERQTISSGGGSGCQPISTILTLIATCLMATLKF